MFILILMSHIYGGYTLAPVTGRYDTSAECEAAGKLFEAGNSSLSHVCLPAPKYAPLP
jgi:hypothetical protein